MKPCRKLLTTRGNNAEPWDESTTSETNSIESREASSSSNPRQAFALVQSSGERERKKSNNMIQTPILNQEEMVMTAPKVQHRFDEDGTGESMSYRSVKTWRADQLI